MIFWANVAESLCDSPSLLDQRRSFSLVSTSRGATRLQKNYSLGATNIPADDSLVFTEDSGFVSEPRHERWLRSSCSRYWRAWPSSNGRRPIRVWHVWERVWATKNRDDRGVDESGMENYLHRRLRDAKPP